MCYLFVVDGFRFLLDCGWTAKLNSYPNVKSEPYADVKSVVPLSELELRN
jgi:hypothetical protein